MKKVLVLCQRKKGWLYAGQMDDEDVYKKAENTVVPKIEKRIRSLVGEEYEIEYLSAFATEDTENKELMKGEVDIEGLLKNDTDLILKGNKKIAVRDFIEKNEGTYDIILLNTCPLQNMDFYLISQLLASDGLMVVAAYAGSGNKISVKNRITKIPNKFFTLDKIEGDEALIYKKKLSPHKRSPSPKRSLSEVTPPYKKGGRHTKKRHTKKRHMKKRHTKKRHTKKRHTKKRHTKKRHTKKRLTKKRLTKSKRKSRVF